MEDMSWSVQISGHKSVIRSKADERDSYAIGYHGDDHSKQDERSASSHGRARQVRERNSDCRNRHQVIHAAADLRHFERLVGKVDERAVTVNRYPDSAQQRSAETRRKELERLVKSIGEDLPHWDHQQQVQD